MSGELDGLYQRAQTRATPLLTKLADLSDEEWGELTHRMTKHFERELGNRGMVIVSKSRDAYWKAKLREVGARPVTCLDCAGSGTVNAAETEPCESCDGSGTDWIV